MACVLECRAKILLTSRIKKNASIWFPTAANAHLGGDFFVIARIGHFRQKRPSKQNSSKKAQ